ncbi:MAG: LamG-like jellyroll fold domain-containing protein [Verrucomicrobiota bacterium]
MKPEEFDILLERHLDGSLTESEEHALTEILGEHEWAQDRFVDRMSLAADLRDRLTADSPRVSKVAIFPKSSPTKKIAIGLAAAAALAFGMFLLQSEGPAPKVRVIAAEGVGTLDSEALHSGRRIKLRHGLLELELNGESRVVIEGPAKFKIVSPRLLELSSGRCFAEMKKGRSGLRIETPAGKVLDLGTKFAVDVTSPKEMKVHVFDGMVEVSDGPTKKRLTEGQSIRVADAQFAEQPADSSLFIPRVPRAEIDTTPYVYWGFNEGQGETFSAAGRDLQPEKGIGSFTQRGNAAAKPTWVSGIDGSALEFDSKVWANTEHPGIGGNQDRTVACWIKIPDDPKQNELSPLISWGLREGKETSQSWMLAVARYTLKKPETAGVLALNFGNQRSFGTTNLRDGQWHHVAVVAMEVEDGSAILFYIDGQLESTSRAPLEFDTEIGENLAFPIQFGRHLFARDAILRGTLDEAYLFAAALSGDEIRQLMTRRPSQP